MAEINWTEIIVPAITGSGVIAVVVTMFLTNYYKRAQDKRDMQRKIEEQQLEAARLVAAQKLEAERLIAAQKMEEEHRQTLLNQARETAEQTVSTEVLKIGLDNVKTMQSRDTINIEREKVWLNQINQMQRHSSELETSFNQQMEALRVELRTLREDNLRKDSINEVQAQRIRALEDENTTLKGKVLQLEQQVRELKGVA